MRVVVNQLPALGIKTGIGHYTVQLLRCLRQQAGEDDIEGFPEGCVAWLRAGCARLRPYLDGSRTSSVPACTTHHAPLTTHDSATDHPRFSIRRCNKNWRAELVSSVRILGRAAMARYFALVHRMRGYDLYHEPNFIPLAGDQPVLATFHDLSVLLHPEWHPADRVAYFEKHFYRSLDRCLHFLAISEFGRQEIIRTLGVPPERVTRTYLGIRPGLGPLPPAEVARTLDHLGLPPRYLLYVGTIEPRKNVLVLLQAYCDLPASVRQRWPLLLVGSWGWNAGAVARYLSEVARHRGVVHIGYLPERHLGAVYNGARALAYPSLYEGLGLPPLEMMACGGAVLASRVGALVETVAGHADLLDPHDIPIWRDALRRVVEDEDWRHSLRQGVLAVARPFSWERCAAETLRVYRTLYQRESATLPAPYPVHAPAA
jgi:glycosyltransferase involved in cell wall biosynthesis